MLQGEVHIPFHSGFWIMVHEEKSLLQDMIGQKWHLKFTKQFAVVCDVTPRNLVHNYQLLGGTCSPSSGQGRWSRKIKMMTGHSETSVLMYQTTQPHIREHCYLQIWQSTSQCRKPHWKRHKLQAVPVGIHLLTLVSEQRVQTYRNMRISTLLHYMLRCSIRR